MFVLGHAPIPVAMTPPQLAMSDASSVAPGTLAYVLHVAPPAGGAPTLHEKPRSPESPAAGVPPSPVGEVVLPESPLDPAAWPPPKPLSTVGGQSTDRHAPVTTSTPPTPSAMTRRTLRSLFMMVDHAALPRPRHLSDNVDAPVAARNGINGRVALPTPPDAPEPPGPAGSIPPPAFATLDRPDLLAVGDSSLRPIEKLQIRVIRSSFEPGAVDQTLRWCQRNVGARWMDLCTKNLRHVYGTERLPTLDPKKSYVCVCNHRSFFDLYMVTTLLVLHGMPHRMLFPVRSNFFYDRPLGFAVNGVMSFFAMYPPIFRERARAPLNLAGIDEVAWLARRGGAFIGMHPEGTRNKDGDPYEFLPAQSGIGRIIRQADVEVIPVFVNGLVNDIVEQVTSNAKKKGVPIVVVFGKPIDFGGLLQENPSPRLYKRIADRSIDAIRELSKEEREIRAGLVASGAGR